MKRTDTVATPAPEATNALAELIKIADDKKAEQDRLAEKHEAWTRRLGIPTLRLMNLERSHGQQQVFNVISHYYFDMAIGIVICFNAIIIGMESHLSSKGEASPAFIPALEALFLIIYTGELSLRLYASGIRAWDSHWVKFDTCLVGVGWVETITKVAMAGKSPEELKRVMFVRLLRLARLARAVRLFQQFKDLWKMVQGLINCCVLLFWTLVMVGMFLYIFTVLGLEVISQDDSRSAEYNAAVAYFDGLSGTMLVLLQFLTLDSIGGIYRPLVMENPMLGLYFIAFILVVSIALMNLVTAIMVDSSMQQGTEDRVAEKAWLLSKKAALIPRLKDMFEAMDTDGSGDIDLDELLSAPEEVKDQLGKIIELDNIEELFGMLDIDGGGSISADEFCEGILKSQEDKPLELYRITKQCNELMKRNRDMETRMANIEKSLAVILDSMGRAQPNRTVPMLQRMERMERLLADIAERLPAGASRRRR